MKKLFFLRVLFTVAVLCMAIAPLASAGMGQALFERWDSAGTADTMLTESSPPDYTEILTGTEWGIGDDNALEDYRGRITAFLIPPVTGEYIFWIVTDDNGRLWLSSNHDPNNAELIATETNWAAEDGWGSEGDEAQSDAITLEGGKPYWLRGGYQETGGGDHIRIAWGSADAGIADRTIITGQYITDDPTTIYYYAYNPNPADGAQNVSVEVEDLQLSWSAPILITDPEYSVYFGTDANSLPLHAGDLTETTIPVDVDTNKTYAWRVDVHDPNLGGTPVVYVGPIWSFTTVPDTPVVLTQPQDAYVFVGETATFTIGGYSANSVPFDYEWFKEDAPGTILSTTDTLTITNAQEADEGSYLCTLSNTYGDTTSEPADLFIKRLVGHWPFEQNVTDIVGGNDGTAKKDVYVEGIVDAYAIEFSNAPGGGGVEISSVPYTSPSLTISFWDKASTEDASAEYETAVGSGPAGWEILDIGRYRMAQYYFSLDNNYVYTPLGEPYARGEWNMLTLTYDASTNLGTLYINGQPALESGEGFDGFDPALNLIVGEISDEYAYYGAVDDLRLYNYALEPLEIAVLYTDSSGETVCFQNPETDVSGPEGAPDCVVDIYDLVELAGGWLECNLIPAKDCL